MNADKSVMRYFELNAKTFDALYGEHSTAERWFNNLFRRALYDRGKVAIAECVEIPDFTLLDIGCGSGRIAAAAASGGSRVVGIDFSEPMLAMARAYAQAQGVSDKCDFRLADFMETSLDTTFDCSLALGVFDYVAEPVPFLQHMREATKHKAIATFPAPDFPRAPLRKWRYARRGCPVYFYRKAQVPKLFADAGFDSCHLHKLQGGYLAVGYVSGR